MATSKYGYEISAAYNRRDALRTKLLQANADVNAAESALDRALAIQSTLRQQLEDLDIVQVAYLTTPAGKELTTPLQNRETFDYIDGTAKGLQVGDVVVAPTRYSRYQRAIVVQVGGQRTYFGRLNRITEVLYP